MPFCRASAWIKQLQSLLSSAYGPRAQPPVKADKPSLVMHCQRKKVGVSDLTVLEKCVCPKHASGVPRKSVSPKEVVRMRKQPLK
jgi:hypothetical protein